MCSMTSAPKRGFAGSRTGDAMVRPFASLTLEEYAATAAHVLHASGGDVDRVLAELSVPAEVWRASALEWERAMDDELARGGAELLTTFAVRFVAARTLLGRRTARATTPEAGPVTRRAPIGPAVPAVPDVPIGPETAAIDSARLSRPAVPFASIPPEPSDADDAARRALAGTGLPFVPAAQDGRTSVLPPEPPPIRLVPGAPQGARRQAPPPEAPPVLSIEPTTVRLDSRWLPPPSVPEPAALPLVRVRRRSGWLRRVWRWIRG